MDGRTDGRTVVKKLTPVSYRTSSPSGPLPKKGQLGLRACQLGLKVWEGQIDGRKNGRNFSIFFRERGLRASQRGLRPS